MSKSNIGTILAGLAVGFVVFLLLQIPRIMPSSNCDMVDRNAHWLTDDVTTCEQLRAEINEMMVDNRCDGITPAKLRKVLLDMEKVK